MLSQSQCTLSLHHGVVAEHFIVCFLFDCNLDDEDLVTVNNVGALTAFIKIDVTFDRYNISVSNTDDIEGTGHPVMGYNLFTINDLLSMATDGAIEDAESVAEEGAIIMV